MVKKSIVIYVCFVIFVVGHFGCRKTGLKGLVSCQGVVTLDSKPVEGAFVTFIPKTTADGSGQEQRNASATSAADGHFKMTTLREGDGIFPGTYTVIVTKHEMTGEVVVLPEIDNETGEHLTIQKSANRLPKKYEIANTSPLEITIPKSGDKKVELSLDSK